MKHLYLFSFASFILLAACKKDKISGSGDTMVETLPLKDFTAIQASGPLLVFVEKNAQFSVEVSAFENLLPHVELKVNNGLLDVHWKNNVEIEGNNLAVYVKLPDLKSVKVSNRSGVAVYGQFTATNMEVSIAGSGYVHLDDQQADNFLVNVSGVSLLSGMVMNSFVEAFGMKSKKAQVNLTGNGKVELTCFYDLTVNIDGKGSVFYKGNPALTSEISGGGMIYKR